MNIKEMIKEIKEVNNIDDIFNILEDNNIDTCDFRDYAQIDNMEMLEYLIESQSNDPFRLRYLLNNLEVVDDYFMLDGYGNTCYFNLTDIIELAIEFLEEIE